MVCSRKSFNMYEFTIFLGHLVYRLYLPFLVFSVQFLCEDGDSFAKSLEKTLGVGVCDSLVLQVASVSASPIEHCNHASAGLL